MSIFGYARVSTDGQTLDSQILQLKAAQCAEIFKEKASGVSSDRAQLKKILAKLGKGDVVVVTRLDRLPGRSGIYSTFSRRLQRRVPGSGPSPTVGPIPRPRMVVSLSPFLADWLSSSENLFVRGRERGGLAPSPMVKRWAESPN